VDAERVLGPFGEVFVKVTGGVGKDGKEEDFPHGFTVFVFGGICDVGGNEFLDAGQLGIAGGNDRA
jgi:hypothetical protein